MQLFVYHTPEATPTDHLPECAVVIDVLRATTTIATALNAGAASVQAFSDIDKLLQVSDTWEREKRLRAGERGGKTVAGCDLGNSPLEFNADRVKGRRVFISTTNGTRALQRVEQAKTVITAAQANRQAVVSYLQETQPETVWLVGSGWQGGYSLEDTACAGAIAQVLTGYETGNDEVVAAIALYEKWHNNLVGMFKLASHGQRLLRLDGDADLDYCARTDILETVPIQTEPGVLVANR